MAYLFIFLAIAAVLGPLMAVMPSRRQRALMVCRDRAAAGGVSVTLKEPESVPPRLMRLTDDPLVCYSVRLVPRDSRALVRDLWVKTREGWESKSGKPVPPAVTRLPDGAEVAVTGWDDIRVYWNERGGDEAVDQVITCLHQLRAGESD